MLGAIIGDIVGSVYEFDNISTKDFPLFRPDCRFTDDTVCTVAVADIVLNHRDPTEAMLEWCRNYRGRGYGDRFMRWFMLPTQEPYNSYGNGAAMRVSPVAYVAASLDDALTLSDRVTEITHNHPEGMKGARATAQAVFLARKKSSADYIRASITRSYGYDLSRSVDDVRNNNFFDESCQKTVPVALICALEATDFEDAIRNAMSIGGDSDTIGAIAGAIAEARFGIPSAIRETGYRHLPGDMAAITDQLYRATI